MVALIHLTRAWDQSLRNGYGGYDHLAGSAYAYALSIVDGAASPMETLPPQTALCAADPVDSLKQILADCIGGCESRLQFWERALPALAIAGMAEIGVWKGAFAAHVLARCPNLRTYHMVDPWRRLPDWNKPYNVDDGTFEMNFREAMDGTAFAGDRRAVHRGTTSEVIDRIPDASLDLAYLDGDRTLRGITIDCLSLYPKLRAGGYLAGNGLLSNPWHHGAEFEPTLVFPFVTYFAEAVGGPCFALPFRQFLIQKPLDQSAARYEYVDFTGDYADRSLRSRSGPD